MVGDGLLPVFRRTSLVCLPIERIDQPGEEVSFGFPLCSAVTTLASAQPGIQQVPHRVAEHVEGVDDNREEKPRPEGQPGRLLHEAAPFPAEHPSPAGHLDGQPESEKAQRRLGNDDPADVDREDDDDRCHNIGQDMADQDLARGGAHGPGGQKIIILFDADHRASYDAGASDATSDPQHHDDLKQALPHDRHDGQQEQQPREGHPGIDKALHCHVHFSPQES